MKKLYYAFAAILLASGYSYGQSTNCNNNAGAQISVGGTCNYQVWDIPDNGNYWTAYTGCSAAGTNDVWAWFVASSTSTTVNYNPDAATSFNPVIHVFTGGCSATMTALACSNAHGNNLTESITFATVVGQTYRIRIEPRNVPAGNGSSWGDLCVFNTPAAPSGNLSCSNPTPICSGTPITFTANTGGAPANTVNPGNEYGCLYTSPNPTWYYLEIANPGQLTVNISAGSDVDFAVWGPFANLSTAQSNCNNYVAPIDCSYSTSATEQMNVSGVLAGQVYVLLVTNYANTVQSITVNNAGGSATTNCSIVPLPVGFSFWDASLVGEDVMLMWETESEQNCSHFLVQRSTDGSIWETIGVVEGQGTTSEQTAYSYRDQSPAKGINYYRLNQVDLDGNSKLTSTLYINTVKRNDFAVFPNPSAGIFTIAADPKDVDEVFLTDMIGKRYAVQVAESGEMITVIADGMEKGAYNLIISSKGEKIVQRITIQ